MRALVVDDSRTVRIVIRRILTELGFEVFEAGHGQEALDVLEKTGAVDVMMVDWNMPVMTGIELIRAVRGNKAYRDINIVMVTTETEMERVVQALAAGAHEYVMKPFNRELLVSKLSVLGLIP